MNESEAAWPYGRESTAHLRRFWRLEHGMGDKIYPPKPKPHALIVNTKLIKNHFRF